MATPLPQPPRTNGTDATPSSAETTGGGCEAGGCSLSELFRLLGKAHVLGVLYLFHEDPAPKRFNEIQTALDISPNTLSERLKELVGAGLLVRTAYNEIPPRVDYESTVKAAELGEIFQTLCAWAGRHSLACDEVAGEARART